MKKSLRAFALFVLAAFLCVACDTGSSDGDMEFDFDPTKKDPDATKPDDTKNKARSPLATDTLPVPGGTAWYRFANDYYDMALTGTTMTYTDTTFAEMTYWWDGDSWELVIGLKGTLANKNGSEYDATLTDIYLLNETGGGSWYASASDEFKGYIGYIWSKAGDAVAHVSYADSGTALEYKRDQSGDDDMADTIDTNDSFGKTNYTTLTGHGRYPYGGWASLSIGGGNIASSSIEIHSAFPDDFDNSSESLIKSISATIQNQNGHVIGPVDYAWVPDEDDEDDGDWEHDYNISAYTDGGIWYLKTYTILWKNGAKSTYTAADPWSKYSVAYTTNTGYASTMTVDDRVGQDYKAPATHGTGREFRYVRTLPNKSSADDDDVEMYLYKEGDTEHWIAANDDWFEEGEGGYSTICYPVEASTKYYVKIVELNKERAAYSIVLSDQYNLDAIRTTVLGTEVSDADAGEGDDVSADAKALGIDTPLYRVYDIDDPDWFTFTTPATWP